MVEVLNGGAILNAMPPSLRGLIREVLVLEETDSTQEVLLRLPSAERHGRAVLAERQLGGKGRRGRDWQSPAGNIWLSVGWRFDRPADDLGGLGPVAGVCVCRALGRLGLKGHGIKWPNDIQVSGSKLCGILVETRARRAGCDAIFGIGVNVDLGDEIDSNIDQPWTDLERLLGAGVPERNVIVAAILEELLQRLEAVDDLASFLAASWPRWDLLEGQDVRVFLDDGEFEGTVRGITPVGALRVVPPGEDEPQTFHSGEVSIRRA